MLYYVAELSKYFICLCMLLYILSCAFYFFLAERRRKWIIRRQRIYIILMQLLSYLTMSLLTGKVDYIFFCFFLQIVLFSYSVLFSMIYPGAVKEMMNHMILMINIGFIILARLDLSKAYKQFFIVIFSLIVTMFVPYLMKHLTFLKNIRWVYAAVGVVMLGIVLILGQVTHGSKISYSIGEITFQPSEFVKIIFIFCIAAFLNESLSFKNIVITTLVAAMHVIILVLSRDLGSALIFFMGYLLILFIATKNYLYLLGGAACGSVAAVVSYKVFRHVRVRVAAFLNPLQVIENEGFQISQSLFALTCGSWFGTGLMKGSPTDIPYVESDFIFSAVAEEMGVIVAIAVLIVCLCCFYLFMNTAFKTKDRFYKLLCMGLGIMYIFQVFLTVGGGIKFIPLTGVTLPFISYGGSSIMTSLLAFSVYQGIAILSDIKQPATETKYEEEAEYED